MRILKKMSGFLLSLCMIGSMTAPAMAAEKEAYTYTIRFLAGAQGTFDPAADQTNNGHQSPSGKSSGECLVFEDLKPGQEVNFNTRMIKLKDSGKYYVKGIRESGKDNNTVYYLNFQAEADKDYVVAYGILGDSVAYTIRYEDASGRELAPSETYYGNVGDRPVVSYLYIDGYQPQAYNLIGRLTENASDNVFTFVYTRVEPGTVTTTTTTIVDGGTVTEDGGTTVVEGGVAGGAAGGGAGGAGAGAGGGGAAADAGTEVPDEAVPQGPADIMSIDDEEVPLANGSDIPTQEGSNAPMDFATLMAVPLSAKVGICSALALIAGFAARYFIVRKRKKEEENE